jgi:hypothetical protein
MKSSVKLLVAAICCLLVLFFVNAYSIKSEYLKINKKDAFWNFKKVEVKPFKYVKVLGNRIISGKFLIIKANENKLNISPKMFEKTHISSNGDTLMIFFEFTKKDIPLYQNQNIELALSCPEVSGIFLDNQMLVLQDFKQKYLQIFSQKDSDIRLDKNEIENLNVHLGDNSILNFESQIVNARTTNYFLDEIEIVMRNNTSVKMENVFPKKVKLKNEVSSKITMNGETLNKLKK